MCFFEKCYVSFKCDFLKSIFSVLTPLFFHSLHLSIILCYFQNREHLQRIHVYEKDIEKSIQLNFYRTKKLTLFFNRNFTKENSKFSETSVFNKNLFCY